MTLLTVSRVPPARRTLLQARACNKREFNVTTPPVTHTTLHRLQLPRVASMLSFTEVNQQQQYKGQSLLKLVHQSISNSLESLYGLMHVQYAILYVNYAMLDIIDGLLGLTVNRLVSSVVRVFFE